MPRLARSSARCGPTPLIMRTSAERVRVMRGSLYHWRRNRRRRESGTELALRGGPPPQFFVNVASKGLRIAISALESTLAGGCSLVDSKEVKDEPGNKKASETLAV